MIRFLGHLTIWEKGVHDAKSKSTLPLEFRQQMVELVRAGRRPEELLGEFEPSAQAIRNWVAQAGCDEGRRGDGLTSGEREGPLLWL